MYVLRKKSGSPSTLKTFWDDKYARESLEQINSEEFRKQMFWPTMRRYLEPDRRYLDVGCGLGGWMMFLRGQGYDVAGVDAAANTIQALQSFDPSLPVQVGLATALPHQSAQFDGLLALGVLEYVEGAVAEALQEMNRVLKPGGYLFLEVPLYNVLRGAVYGPLKRAEKLVREGRGEAMVFANYFFGRSELHTLLREMGFSVIADQPHELPEPQRHYGLYTDWPFLRKRMPYELNNFGLAVKKVSNALSPWVASTGIFIVAQKEYA